MIRLHLTIFLFLLIFISCSERSQKFTFLHDTLDIIQSRFKYLETDNIEVKEKLLDKALNLSVPDNWAAGDSLKSKLISILRTDLPLNVPDYSTAQTLKQLHRDNMYKEQSTLLNMVNVEYIKLYAENSK